MRVSLFIKAAAITNRIELMTTNTIAETIPILPDGISLFYVLGLRVSKFLSTIRLNPIAAFRAKIIHKMIRINSLILKSFSVLATARENPTSAKGIANMVWPNLTNEK